jgi:hypothetical protein
MAPANTPAPIVAKLNAEVNKALASKEIRDQFAGQGVEPMQMTSEELGAFVKASSPSGRRWSRTPARRSNNESMLAPADTIARTLSGFVNRMRLDQVPAAVSLRARHLMLDAIGCALAARKEQFASHFSQATHALSEGQGERAVIGFAQAAATRRRAAQWSAVSWAGL